MKRLGVYFVDNGTYTKIGYSKDIDRRFREIKTHIPDDCRLLFELRGATPKTEKQIHFMLQEYRVRREWFLLSAKQTTDICIALTDWSLRWGATTKGISLGILDEVYVLLDFLEFDCAIKAWEGCLFDTTLTRKKLENVAYLIDIKKRYSFGVNARTLGKAKDEIETFTANANGAEDMGLIPL